MPAGPPSPSLCQLAHLIYHLVSKLDKYTKNCYSIFCNIFLYGNHDFTENQEVFMKTSVEKYHGKPRRLNYFCHLRLL